LRAKTLVFAGALILLGFVTCGWSALVNISFGESGLNEVIPDNSASGMFRSLTVSGYASQAPYFVSVDITVQGTGYGAINGNYYSYLRHTSSDGAVSQLAVLLNRVGVRADSPTGYLDNGLAVTLDDRGGSDIHNYRWQLNGNHNDPVVGRLTGTWQPDGRNVDPYGVTDSSPRTTALDSLGVGNPNGTWTLFFADLQAGGTGNLTDWQVRLTPTPEPSSAVLLALGGFCVWAFRRKRNRTKGKLDLS